MNATDVNLYLVGFMGTGKSTVGRAVAQRLGFQALDSDHEIERLGGKTIPEIFAGEGEPAFRAREREFITGGHPAERTVVSCGGFRRPAGLVRLFVPSPRPAPCRRRSHARRSPP